MAARHAGIERNPVLTLSAGIHNTARLEAIQRRDANCVLLRERRRELLRATVGGHKPIPAVSGDTLHYTHCHAEGGTAVARHHVRINPINHGIP